MRRWLQTVFVCIGAGLIPVSVQDAQAEQLPDDVNSVSRSRLPPVDREELDPVRRETYDAGRQTEDVERSGMGAGVLRLHGSGTDLRFSGPLGRRLTEIAILTTAREIDQPYEWALHELDALAVGVDEVIIDIIRHRKPTSGVGDPEAIIMDIGRELLTTRRLGAETYAHALQVLGKTNLVDLVDLIGRYTSTGATLTAVNQQMPMGWRQSLPLPFTYPDDIYPDSRSRLPLRPGPYQTSVNALYGRMASPGGIGPGQIRAYGEGIQTLEARIGKRLEMLAVLVTARAHNSQYDWTMHEPLALEAGLEREVIDVVKHRRAIDDLDDEDATLVSFARELFGDHNVRADTYARAKRAFGETDLVDIVALMGAHAADAVMFAGFDQQLPEGVAPLLPLP
ncbi:MAG: carboxymuconolactone decarboxylase family protein [Vicinamibacterales bacterium]